MKLKFPLLFYLFNYPTNIGDLSIKNMCMTAWWIRTNA